MKVLQLVFVVFSALALGACATLGGGSPQMVKYSYEGAPFTVFTGAKPPWTTESRVTGWFIHEELEPNATYDFLDPDIEFPFVNLPPQFSFTDGARSITETQLEAPMKVTGDRLDPTVYEVRAFSVRTDENGDIEAWDVLFVHDVRASTFLTAHNGGVYGQDLVEVDATHWGCVATAKCTANANYTNVGPIFDSWFRDLQKAGDWTKEVVAQ